MNLLETQEQFEELWFLKPDDKPIQGMRLSDKAWIVYFTAAWCGPCKALDLDAIVEAATAKNIPVWKCDDTINNYTGGYCAVRKFPTFILMRPKSIVSTLQSAKTQDVVDWINTCSV
jgi:thiol-disulfide isomerase/thioredoxin